MAKKSKKTQYLEARRKLENDSGFQRYLRKNYSYKDGALYHRDREVGYNAHGYLAVKINYNNKIYAFYVHRVIYFLVHNYFPQYIDHINRNGKDNNIENIREASITINNRNCYQKQYSHGISKYLGVYKAKNKWRAMIKIFGNSSHIGVYDTIEEAALARDVFVLKNKLTDRYKLNFKELYDNEAY